MDQKQLKEVIKNPEKLWNLVRALHQALHLYEMEEAKKMEEQRRGKGGTGEKVKFKDSVSLKLTDSNGKVKREVRT